MTKSILRQTQANTSSWFSKLNSDSNTPRLQLFGSFRKPTEDRSIDDELQPKLIRRVRFPIHMTTEYVFKRDDVVTEKVIRANTELIQVESCAQLLALYESICQQKQEPTIDKLVAILTAQTSCLTRLDLSNQLLNASHLRPLCDLLSVDFGLQTLVLDDCGLEDETIKMLAHTLFYHDHITHLSLAHHPKLTHQGFKYLAIYLKKSNRLVSLNLSYTQPDKKSLEYLTAATLQKTNSLSQLILDGCPLKAAQLEVLASKIRNQDNNLRHLSLAGQHRLLSQQGALSIGIMLRDYDSHQLHGLRFLSLDYQEIDAYGMQYITQALRRNQQLKQLSMRECKVDAKSCHLLGEALRYNQHLEQLDLAGNPLCQPHVEGIIHLAQALNVNQTLQNLCLANTGLLTEAIIALAESLPQNKSLIRLDLSDNHAIEMAGFMALAASLQMNHTMTYIDIHTPDHDHDRMMLHHQMLAKCTQNAQSKQTHSPTPVQLSQATARLTLEERLAAVTGGKVKKSTPAPKAIDMASMIQQAIDYTEQLEQADDSLSLDQCKQFHQLFCTKIPELSSSNLDIVLAVNDRLTAALEAFESKEVTKVFEIGDDDEDKK